MSAERDSTAGAEFRTTRWSLVLRAAAAAADPRDARDALESLLGGAWYPLYSYLRRRGHGAEEARDLTQGFLADLLARGDVARADKDRGPFRAFLLAALKHYVANQAARERAAKRGGGARVLSLDFADAEARYGTEPVDARTPESVFTERWASGLLERVVGSLAEEYRARGKSELFALLGPCLGGDAEALPYAEIARRLDASEGAVKVAVHRLRARYRAALRAEIAHTVADPGDVDDEIRALFDAFARPS